MDQISPKRIFPVEKEKSEHHYWIQHIWISAGTKFQLQLIILTFWTKFAQKGYFHSKAKKENSIIEFCIFELVLVTNSASTDNFDFLDQICPKRVFLIKNRTNEHHHSILHVRIGVGTKFQPKVRILIFWTKFARKGHFHSKTKKVNNVIKLYVFELG